MEALLKMVQEKAGISPEQAKTAVDTVLSFIKDKVPGVGSQLDSVLGNLPGGLGDAAKKIF